MHEVFQNFITEPSAICNFLEPGVSVQYQGDIESAVKYLENTARVSGNVDEEEELSDTVLFLFVVDTGRVFF